LCRRRGSGDGGRRRLGGRCRLGLNWMLLARHDVGAHVIQTYLVHYADHETLLLNLVGLDRVLILENFA
jgi:hypothetical protein